MIASYFPLITKFTAIPTVFKLCVDQVLGTVEQVIPALVHDLLDSYPRSKAESLNPPVVEGGPPVTVDKGKADKEDQEVD